MVLLLESGPVDTWVQSLLHGPGHLRFFVQPLVALLLGMRDGRLDALAGRPAWLLALVREKGRRSERLREGLKAVLVPLTVATLLDALLQAVVIGRLHLWLAFLVGGVLCGLPYTVARGFTNRALRRRHLA